MQFATLVSKIELNVIKLETIPHKDGQIMSGAVQLIGHLIQLRLIVRSSLQC